MQNNFYVTVKNKTIFPFTCNKMVFICDSYEQASIVAGNAFKRSKQVFINISASVPEYSTFKYQAKFRTIQKYPKWYQKN